MAEAVVDNAPAKADGKPPLFGLSFLENLSEMTMLRQVGLMVGLAASVAIGFAVVLWSQQPDYRPLYGSLAGMDSKQIMETLAAADIAYTVEPNSGALLVKADDVARARMKLAAAGVTPSDANIGFEILDKDQGLGTSQFMEATRYRRGLEGELARTISSLNNVKGARVHLAIPKSSVFVRDERKPSASVLVELFSGRSLEPGQVHAGSLDVVQAGNGARQFAFQTTAIARGFHKLAGAQALVFVEDFKADIAVGRRDPGGGELEARAGNVIGLDQQGARVRFDGVGNVGGGQGFGHLFGVHTGQTAVKRSVIRLLRPQDHRKANGHACSQTDHKADLTQHGHFSQVVQKGKAKQRGLTAGRAGIGRNVIRECICHDLISPLNRHLHDVLVRLNQLVTHLGQSLKGNAGLLRGDHYVRQIDTTLADFKSVRELSRRLLSIADLVDRITEHVGEAAGTRFRRGLHRRFRLRQASICQNWRINGFTIERRPV